ncbi:MAG: hypothetical protein IT477_10255, partial [Rhodanobacteraceae bacterium]|nr:hypothetical protein [Rhodanobacteraceae bacterium]
SRLQNYFKSRARHNAKDQDLGTYPVHSYDSVQDGFCDERFWPYDISKVYTAPDAQALRHSFDQSHEGLALRDGTKLSTWEHKQLRLSDDGDEREQQSKQVVASDLGVAVGLDVDQGFQDYTNGIWRYRGPSKGRHYVLITRFTPYAAYCRSSWGARYGEEGGIWVAWSEIRNPRLCTDPMVLLRLPLTSDSMA